jgi:mitochondrial import inner membrane translocase subunit TIM22
MNFPGSSMGGGATPAAPGGLGAQDPNVKAVSFSLEASRMGAESLTEDWDGQIQSAMESCFGKSLMSGVMGFGMGGLFGMFMASVRQVPPPSSSPTLPSRI